MCVCVCVGGGGAEPVSSAICKQSVNPTCSMHLKGRPCDGVLLAGA